MHDGSSRTSVIALMLTALLVFPANRANAYWAIAYAQGQNATWAAGREFNHTSAAEAASRALEACRGSARSRGINPDSCQIMSSGSDGCSALAVARNDNGYGLAGPQRSLAEADSAAIAACTARNAQGCAVPAGASFCDGTGVAAAAPAAGDEQACAEREGNEAIAACTRVVDARRLQGSALATIYAIRGTAYRKIGNLDLALADFTRTIELLRPSATRDVVASAFLARAAVYGLRQDTQNALADYRSALGLEPGNGSAIEAIRRIEAELAAPQTPAEVDIPDQPLPSNFAVLADVLALIERHPLFANAPPIKADSVITSSSSLSQGVVNGAATTTTSKSETTSRRIRKHVLQSESKMQASTAHSACTPAMCSTNSTTVTVDAANGLISLGYKSNSSAMGNRYISSSTLLRVENVNGTIYPMQVGNRYSYDLTYKTEGAGFNVFVRGRPSCGLFRSVADCRYGYPY